MLTDPDPASAAMRAFLSCRMKRQIVMHEDKSRLMRLESVGVANTDRTAAIGKAITLLRAARGPIAVQHVEVSLVFP